MNNKKESEEEYMSLLLVQKITNDICAILEKYKLPPNQAFIVLDWTKRTIRECKSEEQAKQRTIDFMLRH